jgi:hypothetical protein
MQFLQTGEKNLNLAYCLLIGAGAIFAEMNGRKSHEAIVADFFLESRKNGFEDIYNLKISIN